MSVACRNSPCVVRAARDVSPEHPLHKRLNSAGAIALSASQPTISQTFLRKAAAAAPVTAGLAPLQGPNAVNATAAVVNTPGTTLYLSRCQGRWLISVVARCTVLTSNTDPALHTMPASPRLQCICPVLISSYAFLAIHSIVTYQAVHTLHEKRPCGVQAKTVQTGRRSTARHSQGDRRVVAPACSRCHLLPQPGLTRTLRSYLLARQRPPRATAFRRFRCCRAPSQQRDLLPRQFNQDAQPWASSRHVSRMPAKQLRGSRCSLPLPAIHRRCSTACCRPQMPLYACRLPSRR